MRLPLLVLASLAGCAAAEESWDDAADSELQSALPHAGDRFLCDFAERRFPRTVIEAMGREEARSFTASGATRGNAAWETGSGDLDVESQRGAYWAIVASVITREADGATILDAGLRALEWGLAQQGPDGSFPSERGGTTAKNSSLHAKSTFIEAAARSLLFLERCGAPSPRITALRERLHRSATWLAQARDTADFFARAKNTNQRFFVSTGLQEAGVLLGDPRLIERASDLLAQALAHESGGVIMENGGFDFSYQTVSMELLALHAATLEDREHLMTVLRRALDRLLLNVRRDGTIDDSANTRTVACGAPVPGPGPKGKGIDIIPLRVEMVAHLVGDLPRSHSIALRIEGAGQDFDHLEDCE